MEGFVAHPAMEMRGGSHLAFVRTTLSCDALAGWLQAGDWRLDADAMAPLPSSTPAPDSPTYPRMRWLSLSRPGDSAVAKLASTSNAGGCDANISRLSRQAFEATGPFTVSTMSLTYQVACLALGQEVTLGSIVFGDDGSRALITAEVALVLGTHPLTDASLTMGRSDVTPARMVESMAAGTVNQGGDGDPMASLTKYEGGEETTGTATITSIDPFIATIEMTGLVDPQQGIQSVAIGVRCDQPSGALTKAAIAPASTPTPMPALPGQLDISVGTGADAFVRAVDDTLVTCSFGIQGKDIWTVEYFSPDEDGLSVSLFLRPDEEPSLLIFEGTTFIQVEAGRVGGTLSATVDDRGSEVGFTAEGETQDGRPVNISATCRGVTRGVT